MRIRRMSFIFPIYIFALLGAEAGIAAPEAPGSGEQKLRYNRDIRPILADNCFNCHGADERQRKAKLRLDEREAAISQHAFVPGSPDESEFIKRIFTEDVEEMMPPPKSHQTLHEKEKATLKRWVQEGAEYEKHWAFIPPEKPPVPELPSLPAGWSSPIDAFVAQQLQAHGISPAAPASKETWLRRASFALTGLPPSLTELDEFLADTSAEAPAKVVDRLIASKAYGEHLAKDWLDAARYADSYGPHEDGDMLVWPWRDWVIKAFNNNLPYDQFIREQTAGDLLPSATRDQKVATAFNRLAQQSNESGSDPEEFRLDQVSDRVRANGLAFMGLTVECAKCHDHKYDPISQREYWQMAAFFDNIDENGVYSQFCPKATPSPSLLLPDKAQETKLQDINQKIKAQELVLQVMRGEVKDVFAKYVDSNGLPGASKSGIFNGLKAIFGAREYNPWDPKAKAWFNFEPESMARQDGDRVLVNLSDKSRPGKLRVKLDQVEAGARGKGMLMKGDDEITVARMGDFHESDAFSFAVWLQPMEARDRAVVVSCSRGGTDDGRGYEVVLDNEVPSFALMHFNPGNEIRIRARKNLPLNQWTHLAATYDGSSRAGGLKLYLNGEPAEVDVVHDNLHKDIARRAEWGDIGLDQIRFNLGGREHDSPLKNCGIDEYYVFGRSIAPGEVKNLAGVESTPDEWLDWWLASKHDPWKKGRATLEKLREERTKITNEVLEIMVMKELPAPRPTFIRLRGDHRQKGEPVTPEVLSQVLPFASELPRNRLGLAQWLTDPQHPLVTRVVVNRIWQMFFGRGLVGTPEDFGTRGELPSHPELLDWLATDFRDHGWDVKRLCRMIALTGTFAQSANPADPGIMTKDPTNKWLGRGPRVRLSGEELRDQALAASGLLSVKLGGPSVYPYLPHGIYRDSGLQQDYVESQDDGLYRRSLYTFWRRTLAPPNLAAFDAPTREVCVVRREKTSTPVQALVLLNDPQYVEAQRVTAARFLESRAGDVNAAAVDAFRQLLGREPQAQERQVLAGLLQQHESYFKDHLDEAKALAQNGRHPVDEHLEPSRAAALAMVVRTLMSHVEAVNR
ncbi:MAG: DUF1553 domain-containing protein [Verrucomicrobium sp.]